ncbi:hypothetical protein [Vibrio coralliilyticus]|uniref:hypothetical protein n=1 Tax=Vibrio coralliilyticus TaxID=190893 RepID=UPI000C167A61|nr:hypothetical protein [Vibrio coralliilyticus]
MNCGHCGKEANQGYTVCSGCGAHYRADGRTIFFGLISGVIGIISIKDNFLGGLLFIAIGGFLVKTGAQYKWYRHNA